MGKKEIEKFYVSADRKGECVRMVRITMENEFEADVFGDLLEKEGIPHAVMPHYSLAYDGIFQASLGWGHMEVPDEYAEKAALLYEAYKDSMGK